MRVIKNITARPAGAAFYLFKFFFFLNKSNKSRKGHTSHTHMGSLAYYLPPLPFQSDVGSVARRLKFSSLSFKMSNHATHLFSINIRHTVLMNPPPPRRGVPQGRDKRVPTLASKWFGFLRVYLDWGRLSQWLKYNIYLQPFSIFHSAP